MESHRDVVDAVSGVPFYRLASRWWSNVDEQLAGDNDRRGNDLRHESSVGRANNHHEARRRITGNLEPPHESEFLRAWRMLHSQRPLGMTGLLLGVPVLIMRRNSYCMVVVSPSAPSVCRSIQCRQFNSKMKPFNVMVIIYH